jgi:taurine dioxygenase
MRFGYAYLFPLTILSFLHQFASFPALAGRKIESCMTKDNHFYTLTEITPHFGAIAHGLDLAAASPLPNEAIDQIKSDVKKHRLLIFKNQGLLSGATQVAFSSQLGQLESTFYKHPRSPHPDIFRVSNDELEGCTGVGTTGWHVDGTFQPKPFKYQTMHFHYVCEGGDTWFVPLNEFFQSQDEPTRRQWDKLWMLTGNGNYAHPLVYQHPERGDTAMVLHCGRPFCAGWAVDDETAAAAAGASPDRRGAVAVLPAAAVQEELAARLDAAVGAIGIKVRWEAGDLAVCDNLGTVHYAPPGTQGSRGLVGLRILHRTTIAGETVPAKSDGRRSFLFRQ